jgi:hypothetical protein
MESSWRENSPDWTSLQELLERLRFSLHQTRDAEQVWNAGPFDRTANQCRVTVSGRWGPLWSGGKTRRNVQAVRGRPIRGVTSSTLTGR